MFRRLKKEFSSKLSPHEAEAFSPESPTWCSSKPTKRIKTYGRKRHLRPSLQETTNTTFTNAKNDVSEVTGFEPVPVEPLVEVQQVTAANTKVRRQEKKSTRRDSKFGVQLQGSQARADAKAAREREEMLAKRRAEDEAIEENDRAEREAEVKRARLYSDWQEAKEKGWVIHEVEVQEIHRDTSNLATRRDKEHRRVKRCKMDAEAVEEAIRQLVVERERAVSVPQQQVVPLSSILTFLYSHSLRWLLLICNLVVGLLQIGGRAEFGGEAGDEED